MIEKKFDENNVTIAHNVLYSKKKKKHISYLCFKT